MSQIGCARLNSVIFAKVIELGSLGLKFEIKWIKAKHVFTLFGLIIMLISSCMFLIHLNIGHV